MASFERPIDKIKKDYPHAWVAIVRIAELLNEFNRSLGLPEQSIRELTDFEIVVTDDTTEEEESMQYAQYYLRRGYSLEEAEKKAEERKLWVKEIFDDLDRERTEHSC